MRNVLTVIILIGVLIAAAFFGIPLLIDKRTADMRSEVQDLRQRLQKIEEQSKVAPLPPDADTRKVIKTVNALSLQVNSFENSFKKEVTATNELIQKQKTSNEEAFRKQTEVIEKNHKETLAQIQIIKFDAALANIRSHSLKARMEIVARNIGTAKTELDLIDDLFTSAMTSAPEENKKIINEMQLSLKKAKAEMDSDLPSATNRINTLWYEISKLIRKT